MQLTSLKEHKIAGFFYDNELFLGSKKKVNLNTLLVQPTLHNSSKAIQLFSCCRNTDSHAVLIGVQ